jgi:hypothetical protein
MLYDGRKIGDADNTVPGCAFYCAFLDSYAVPDGGHPTKRFDDEREHMLSRLMDLITIIWLKTMQGN